MKISPRILSIILCFVSASCYYRNHMPVSSVNDSNTKIVEMKVGERRKIQSKTILTEISPGLLMGPADHLRSSNPLVVKIDSNILDTEAWIKAVAPGRADIEYTNMEGRITPILVTGNRE